MALVTKQRSQKPFPWWPLILLIVSVYLFWVLPYQREDKGVQVEFEQPESKK